MSLQDAPFSGKGIAPFLDVASPDRAAACARLTSLFVNMCDAKKDLNATAHVLAPLLALLPQDRCAAGPLATMATTLARGAAYPEALACIDAVVDLESKEPLGHVDEPWYEHSREPMTWPRQQALLWLWRGECRLALGDRAGAEAAFSEGARRANAAAIPPIFGLLGARSPFHGTVADFRLLALVRGARALRLTAEGKDASPYRVVKKKRPAGGKTNEALLALARDALDEALAVIAPRAAEQYAGLVPRPKGEHPALTRQQNAGMWQRFAYFESALVDEHLGNDTRARVHLGRAKWLSALMDPTHAHESELREAVKRLCAENTSLG